jgi:DNA topoisomerase IA
VRALTPLAGKFEKHTEHFENERYVVTSAVGHLVEIKAPEEYDVKRGKWSFAHLPVVPPHFDLAPVDKAKTRLNAVVKLAKRKDVTQLINACDAGREGELIFRLIEQYAGGAKGGLNKPVRRLWLQSMTPQAIRDGFDQLRSDEDMRGLADAARSRSKPSRMACGVMLCSQSRLTGLSIGFLSPLANCTISRKISSPSRPASQALTSSLTSLRLTSRTTALSLDLALSIGARSK